MNAVVLNSEFCAAKVITEFEYKGVYVSALIKKRSYLPTGVPGDLIDTHFEDREVDDVGIIEARTEDNKLFKIFCMKEPYYVMKIMESWMTLDELEGASTRRVFIDKSRTKDKKVSHTGIHLRYRHLVEDHNNKMHAPIYLYMTWATELWPDRNFA